LPIRGSRRNPEAIRMAIVVPTLRRKIEIMHRAGAELACRVRVRERRGERTPFDHDVHVFELFGHPEARYCYAWETRDGRVLTVLGAPPISNAGEAVRSRELPPRSVSRDLSRARDTGQLGRTAAGLH
jgi:hypothetical protein